MKKTHTLLIVALIICMLACCAYNIAHAGETVVRTPGTVILYKPDGTTVKGLKDLAECEAAAPVAAPPGAASRCSVVTNVLKTGTCDAAETPELPTETEGLTTQCPNDENRWYVRADGWKRDAYPSCAWKLIKLPEEPPPFCTMDIAAWMRGDPADIAEAPPVDPEFNEFDPEGPQPGPPGAPPVDKPDTITAHN